LHYKTSLVEHRDDFLLNNLEVFSPAAIATQKQYVHITIFTIGYLDRATTQAQTLVAIIC